MTRISNVIEAEKFLDEELTDKETDFLLYVREGIALNDADKSLTQKLSDYGLIQVISFDNPRATSGIKGIVPTEEGRRILSVIDTRYWARPDVHISSTPKATSMEKKDESESLVRAEINTKPVKVSAAEPQDVDLSEIGANSNEGPVKVSVRGSDSPKEKVQPHIKAERPSADKDSDKK